MSLSPENHRPSQDIPVDHPYEDFPVEETIRSGLVVHHRARGEDGNVIQGSTAPEGGWTAIGTTIHNGVEYTRVTKISNEVGKMVRMTKDVPTDALNRWQETERQAREVAVLGEQAVSAAAGEAPNWGVAEHSGALAVSDANEPVYDRPIEYAITADEARQLMEKAAAQKQAVASNEAAERTYALERAKDEFVTMLARVVEEIDWAHKQTTVDLCYLCGRCAATISQGLEPLLIAKHDPAIMKELKRGVAILEEASSAGLNGNRYASNIAHQALNSARSILDTMALSLIV